MDIQYISDLHLEMRPSIQILPSADYLALLGDIGYPTQPHYETLIKDCAAKFKHVFVVAGNHEYYNHRSMNEIDQRISDICGRFGNVTFLNNSSMTIDNVKIFGGTLWSYIKLEDQYQVSQGMNDYKRISVKTNMKGGGHRKYPVTPARTSLLHQQTIDILRDEIISAREQGQKMVVMTHHAPSFDSISPEFKDDPLSCAFASDLTSLIGDPIVVWMHGHTHYPVDYRINNTRIVSNPMGYPDEGISWNSRAVVTVPDTK